jgi:hypothetical protein
MGRKKLIETDEERRARFAATNARWLQKSGVKEKRNERDKKTAAERFRKWQQANKDKTRLKNANERAARLQRLPAWADKNSIKEFYLNCPTGYHVDHVIPLRGKTVSGLHILENLQYLPAKENMSKGNKFTIEAID